MKTIFYILVCCVCVSMLDTGCIRHPDNGKGKPVADTTKKDTTDALTNFRKSLAQLPVSDQKEIFTCLSPEMKSALWRNRISEVLTRPLKEGQKNMLLIAVKEIKPEAYTPEGRPQFDAFLKEWAPNAIEAFGDSAAYRRLVTQLDDDVVIAQNGPGGRKRCTCSTVDDWCPDDSPCMTASCWPTMDGCGTFGMYACDGMCKE